MANWWTYKDKKKAKANNGTSRQPERHQADAKPAVNNENWWKYRPENSTFYQMQASDRDQLEQQAQMRQYLETVLPYYERYHAARNAVLENRKWDAFSDKIERAIPFMSGDSLAAQERAANIAASRYDRDFPLYQQMMENAVSGRPYNKAYDMAANAHSTAFQKYNAYNNARLQNLHDTDRGAYYAETMDRSEIEAELARLKAGGSTTHISASGAMHGGAGGKIDEPVTKSGDRIAQYERALSILQYRDNTKKYEEIKAAWWSPDNQPELDLTESGAEDLYYSPLKREATELAELGRAAYEKDLANGAHYASSGALHGGYGGKLYSGDEEERNRQLGIDAEAAIEAQVKESALFGPDATHTPAKTYSERGPEEGYLQQWQKDIFYAMYATDPEEAKRWLTLAHEQAENEYLQGVSDETGRNFVTQILGIPLAAGAGILSGLDPFGETGQALSKFSEAVTHGGAKAWNEASGTANIPLLGEKGLGDLYSLGVSMVQSGALAVGSAAAGRYDATLATVVEFLGTTLLGSSAAASDYRQSLNLGLNREQAMRHATAAGIAEAAFEYISLDKLVNQDVSRGFWKNVFLQGGIEASEELCTTLANRASDALLAYAEGYDTSIQQRVKELVALGLSRRDAEYKAEQEWFAELISDGLGGFVSGGLMTAGNTVVNWNEYQSGREQQRTAGEYARNARQTDALRRYAEDNGLGWYAKEQATRTETAQVKDTTSTTSQGEAPYSQGKGSGGQVARATQENDGTGNLSPTTKQTKKSRGEKRQERQQAREQRKQDQQIGSDVQRVQAHIQEQISGKSLQEQQEIRDQLQDKYGDGILPSVYRAISIDAAQRADKLSGSDAIREARNKEAEQIQDADMRRAVVDGYDQAVFGRAMHGGDANEASRYFQQLRNTGTGDMTMEATVEGEDGQSKQVAITGMSEDGKSVVLSDGVKIAVKNLQADADTMDALQQLVDLDLGKDADAVLQAYRQSGVSGTEGYRWLMDYATAYNQGRTNQISLEEAVKRSSLDAQTVMDAYTLGQREAHQSTRDAVESLKAMPKKQGITGKTSNIDTSEIEGVTLNESEREQFELANKLFSLIGVDVKWVASAVKNGRFVGANGSYLNGAVILDVHAGRNFLEQINSGILATTGHELTHFLQQYAPEQYRALKEFLFRQIVQGSANGEFLLERLIWEKRRRASSKLSRRAAEDEVVADACQTMLRDSKAIREFAQQDEEAAKGVVRWLDKWFGKLKQAFSRSAQLTEEARFVDGLAQEVRDAFGKLWDEALREAVETHDRVGNFEKPQQQNSDRDTEYLELAKDPEKNEARLREMVDEAAEAAMPNSMVRLDDAGDDTDRLAKVNSVEGAQFSERDYSLPSDLELMDRAIEGLSEAGGEEYWKALLETDPGLAEDVKGYKDQAKKLAAAEKRLADYKKQMQLGGNRKLNTRGITSLSLEMMKTLDASDAKGRGVAKQVTQTLTSAYQKALDAIDKGTSDADAWDIVYNEGVVPAAEIIAKQGTHSEKTGRGWITTSLDSYYGEGGMQAIIDTVAGYVGADFATNRYRKAIQPTIADKIVERTEKRMQKQVDAATERATEAERINKKLTEDRDFWKNQQAKDSETVTFLNERLKEARQDLRDNKSLTAQERRKLAARIKSLQTQLQAKREEIRALKSLSQQLDKQAVEFGQKQAKLLDKLEQQVQRERDILSGKLKPLGMQRLLKAEREKAVAKAEQHKDEVFRNYKDRQQQAKLRGRIKNLSDEMKRRMTNPSERAYVPASLYESMTRLADVLDDVLSPNPGSKAEAKYRSMMDAIHGLAREYAAVKDLDDPVYSSEYDQEIQEAISDIERVLERKDADWIAELTGDTKKGLRELSTGELQRIYELMRQINYAMVGATSMLGFTGFKNVFDAMQSVVGQMQNEKSLKSLSKHEKAKRLRMLDNLSVMRAVEMMSGWDRSAALYQLFHAIEQGTDESWAWVMGYNKSLQDLKTGKNEKAYRKALTEALDFGITDEEGLKVTMTKMQAIQILMTAEREAHNDKLLHLQTGGAVIRNAEDIQNGKGAKATSQTVKVTPELLQKIQDSLTDWDRAYMKAVRSYFQKEGRRTNEIMYKLKHRVLQTEEYYVPYSVDKNYLETNLDERQAMSMWVKTPGSTNALQQKAKQPVIIDGMDAVMERHVKEIADYIGLALPIRNFSKVYNGMLKTGGDNQLPVKETIDRAFGSKGQHLLTQAVIDVQGGSAKQNWSSGISDFLSGLQSAFVRSALLINPSVTIKQAASYIAAESILSHRALVAGNRATFSSDKTKSPALIAYLFANPEGKTAHRIYNEIDRYTSLHYQRRLGMSQAEIANEANRTGKLKRKMNMIGANMEQSKIGHAVRKTGENLNPVTWIQRMDVATTATLWVACKEQAKLDGMKAGTAEFWQRTTELYERCLRETQPMYDGLHRTAHQKQAGGLVQFLFPFRTVPIQNHGQLAASYETLKASKNKSKAEQAEAKRFFAKTVWAQTESAFIFSMMTFIAAALKRKTKKYRDEDEEFTAESFAKGLMTDVGSTLFSVLVPMYGSELVNIGSRALDKFQGNSGYTYDAFSVGVVDMLNDLASSFDKIAADFGKIARGEDVSFGDVGSHGLAMLLKAAKLAGIPADTVRTYFNGIVGNVEDIANGRIPALNDESWERATGVNAKRFYEAWEAGDEAKMQTVLNEVRQSGKSEDSIANAFNSYAKDAYENNGLSLEQYADYLDKTGMFDAEKISGKVKNLVRDEFQAGERSEDEAISALTGICGMDEDAAWKTVQRWEAGAEHEGEEDYSYSQYEDLREALDAGKSLEEAGKEYLAHGYTEEQIATQAVSWLKDQVTAGKINEDRAIQLLRQYKGMDADKAWKKVQEWKATAAHADDEDYSWSQYDDIDAAIDGNKDIKALVKQLTSHGVEGKNVTSHIKSYLVDRYVAGSVTESALKNQLSRYLGIVAKDDVDKILRDANCKKQYGVSYSGLDEEYRAGNASSSDMRSALMKYGGLSSGDADKKIRWYDLQKSKPDLDISEGACNSWYDGSSKSRENGHESAKDAGMGIEQYLKAKAVLDKIKDSNGNRTGEDEVIAALSGMNLTARQKDALYYERYKGTTKYSRKTW